jgi:hypothetical protein
MIVTGRWTIEGRSQVDRTAVVVSGPMVLHGHQISMVRASEYDALAEQLRGAVKARELAQALVDLADENTNIKGVHEVAAEIVTLLTPTAGERS